MTTDGCDLLRINYLCGRITNLDKYKDNANAL